jgi:hypothetical protein
VVITAQAEVVRLAGCASVASLAIRAASPLDTKPLAELHAIGGELAIGPSVGLDEVALTGLREVGTVRVSANGSLHGLYLPALVQANRIEVLDNVELTTLALPAVVELPGGLVVADNAGLEIIDAPSLVRVGREFVIANQPQLALVDVPKLSHADGARVEANPKLPADVVDHLSHW